VGVVTARAAEATFRRDPLDPGAERQSLVGACEKRIRYAVPAAMAARSSFELSRRIACPVVPRGGAIGAEDGL